MQLFGQSVQRSSLRRPSLSIQSMRRQSVRPMRNVTPPALDIILNLIHDYNNKVEMFNQSLIDSFSTNVTRGGAIESLYTLESNLQQSNAIIDQEIDEYIQAPNIDFNEIFNKTEYYWYDEHLQKRKQPRQIKSLLQRLKKKVIPLSNVSQHHYNEKLLLISDEEYKNGKRYSFLVTKENTYIESLTYDYKHTHNPNYIPCYVCYNEHPFNKTYIESNELKEIDKRENKTNYHIWLKVQNEIYIYSRPSLTQIEITTPTIYFKNVLMLHPYKFFDIAPLNYSRYTDYHDVINTNVQDVECVPFLQGHHYLCWLCSILNIIKLYELHKEEQYIKEEYRDAINQAMKTQSVIEFIKYFNYRDKIHTGINTISSVLLRLPAYNRGNLPSKVIKDILTNEGLISLSKQYLIKHETSIDNPLPIIIFKIHVVPIYTQDATKYFYDSTQILRKRWINDPEKKSFFNSYILHYKLDNNGKVKSEIIKEKIIEVKSHKQLNISSDYIELIDLLNDTTTKYNFSQELNLENKYIDRDIIDLFHILKTIDRNRRIDIVNQAYEKFTNTDTDTDTNDTIIMIQEIFEDIDINYNIKIIVRGGRLHTNTLIHIHILYKRFAKKFYELQRA